MSKSNGFTKLPHGFHKRLCEFTEAEVKVWIALRNMEGKAGTSYPSRETLATYTGLNPQTVSDARVGLRAKGWLVTTGHLPSKKGRFSVPIEHTEVPPIPESRIPTHGGDETESRIPTHGEASRSGTVSMFPTHGTVSRFTGDGPTVVGPTVHGEPTPEVDPVCEVVPTSEEDPPPIPPPLGGLEGGVDSVAPEKTPQNCELTEDAVLNRLEKVHDALWGKTQDYECWGIPAILPSAGKQQLMKALRAHYSNYKTDVSKFLRDLEDGFYLWWLSRYAADHELAHRVTSENEDTEFPSKVAKPLHSPLAVFAKEFPRYMLKAREQRELEADD